MKNLEFNVGKTQLLFYEQGQLIYALCQAQESRKDQQQLNNDDERADACHPESYPAGAVQLLLRD